MDLRVGGPRVGHFGGGPGDVLVVRHLRSSIKPEWPFVSALEEIYTYRVA
jgi:hypothetical protein